MKAADLNGLRTRLREVAKDARAIAAAAPHLADDVAGARAQVDRLASGLNQLSAGAKKIKTGTANAAAGRDRPGERHVPAGQRRPRAERRAGQAATAATRSRTGWPTCRTAPGKLADGLTDGAKEIPGYDDASQRADVLADPVSLDRSVRHPAGTYGVGFAPYFLALALWVGAMITYMVLRPLNRRYLMSAPRHPGSASPVCCRRVRWAWSRRLLFYVVVRFGLGLVPGPPLVTWAAVRGPRPSSRRSCSCSGAALGAAGRIVALALLMLQLTSSGGTYPVQTSPSFFQVIHPLLPMTYVVQAMRHAVDGGTARRSCTAP